MARHFRGTGHILRLIEFMDVGASNGWRLDDVVPAAELVARDRRRVAARAGRARLPGRGGGALPLSRRRRRDRRHRVGHPAVLRRLHPRPPVGRRPPLHVPVRERRPRPARAAARRGDAMPTSRPCSAASGAAAATATRSCARPRPPPRRRSRCPTSAADAGAGGEWIGARGRLSAHGTTGTCGSMNALMDAAAETTGGGVRARLRGILPKGWRDFALQLFLFTLVDIAYELTRGLSRGQRPAGVQPRPRRGLARAVARASSPSSTSSTGRCTATGRSTSPTSPTSTPTS